MGFLQAAELRWEQFERRLQFEFSRAMRPKPWKLRALLVLSAALVALSWLSATHLWSLTEPNPWFMDAVLSVIMPQRLVKGLLSSFSAAGVTTSSGPPDQLQHRLAVKLSSFLVPPPLVRSVCVWGSWLANVLSTAALAAALVSWHVLAVAAVLLFTIVGTTCDTVLAVGWAEYVTASLLVLRAWALVLCLVGSMFFAFALTAPPSTLDTPLQADRSGIHGLTLRALEMVGADPLLGTRIATAAFMQRKKGT